MRKTRILLAGGGTGGHVLPLVAVARAIKKVAPDTKVYFVGPEEFPLDGLCEEGVVVKKIIAAGKVRRYFSPLYIWELIKLPLAAIESFVKVLLINPDVVLGKGSYGSVLPILAARLLGKKIVLHESDVVPGLANRFLSKFVNHIALAFEDTKRYFPNKNVQTVGNPIRLKYLGLNKTEASKVLNINIPPRSYEFVDVTPVMNEVRKTILISGGSQGAQRINSVVLESLRQLLNNYVLIWSTGRNNFQQVVDSSIVQNMKLNLNRGGLILKPLLTEKELAAVYVLCDIVVGRAGSGTIFEAAAFGKPAVLIPIESAGNHQLYNAQAYAQIGAAKILRESELSPETLLKTLNDLMTDDSLLSRMSQNAQKFARIDSAEQLVKILLDWARR